ncbi:MAG: pilus assembly protein PilM [Bacteriovoracaceae bacterium]|jgi:general secretion pathway protein L|nr:pilus assembly protein PilM [Bacteriovoracaceae bacterium]
MKILAIDPGTFSIKIFEGELTKKKVSIDHCEEIIINEISDQFPENTSIDEIHFKIIKSYIKERNFEGRSAFILAPNHYTNRILYLPIENKKKAEALIPFQLEDNLPFNIADTHYKAKLNSLDKKSHALVSITSRDSWEQYFDSFSSKGTLPDSITTASSVVQDYVQAHHMDGEFAIIDFGHDTTKAFFFYNKILVSVNYSGTGGQLITEVLSQTYRISEEDALIYKHKNCFFLTESQYDKVDEDQKEFGLLMKKIFQNFVTDFRRWELGYRVDTGHHIRNIFITGGTSKIKNMANFLAESLGIRTLHLKSSENSRLVNINLDAKKFRSYDMVNILALSFENKSKPLNLRSGIYSSKQFEDIPLHSATYIGLRIGIVMTVLLLSLLTERFFLRSDDKNLNIRLSKVLKTPSLAIGPTLRKKIAHSPGLILRKLKSGHKGIEQEISTINSSTSINALYPLSEVSSLFAAYPDVTLIYFKSDGEVTKAVLSAKDVTHLQKVQKKIKATSLGAPLLELNKVDKKLTVNFGI